MNLCYRLKPQIDALVMFALRFYSKDREHTHTKEFHSLWAPHQTNRRVMWAQRHLFQSWIPWRCAVCALGAGHNLNGFWCLLWCICKNVFTSMQCVFVLAHVLMRTQCVCLCVHDRAVWDFGLNGAMNGGLCWKKKSEKEKEARQRVRVTDNIATSPLPVFNWSTKQTTAQRETEREISLSDVPSRFL